MHRNSSETVRTKQRATERERGGRGSFWSLARVRPSDSRMGEGVQRGSMILRSLFSRIIRYDGEERIYFQRPAGLFFSPLRFPNLLETTIKEERDNASPHSRNRKRIASLVEKREIREVEGIERGRRGGKVAKVAPLLTSRHRGGQEARLISHGFSRYV